MKLKTANAQWEPDNNEEFISYVCKAIVAAYKKRFHIQNVEGVRAIFDLETGEIGIFAAKKIVAEVNNELHEVSLTEAEELIPDITLGETIEIDVTPHDFSEFGRIAAQTAKQLMMQRLYAADKELIKKEFEARKGTCTTGQVVRLEEIGNSCNLVIVNLGRVDGHIPPHEQVAGEIYQAGNRVRVYVLGLKETEQLPEIIVSRIHPELIRELLELYVPEIEDGTIEIKTIVREAGYRTKVAVHSARSEVDPVSLCLGACGVRIQNVVAELGNEKIDVIRYSSDPLEYISNALSPARITAVALYPDYGDKRNGRAEVIVPDDQLNLATGPNGRNLGLASKLTDWQISIKSESQAGGEAAN